MMGSGILTTDFKGYFGQEVRLYQHMGDGYPTGEYYIDHLTREHIQFLADWMLTLPEEMYAPLKSIHQGLERFLHTNPF